MAEWERREKRLVELILPTGTWGAGLQRALYAAESEWREGRGFGPNDPVPPMAVTVHAEGGELVVRFEVVDDQPVEAPDATEGDGRGDVQP